MKFRIWSGIAALSLLFCSSSQAAFLAFDDTLTNDLVRISVGQFEGGFFINGGLVEQGLGSNTVDVPEFPTIQFSGTWIAPGDVGGSRTIYLMEDATQVSDILAYNWSPNGDGTSTISGTFTSDSEVSLGLLPQGVDPGDVFLETPGLDVGFSAPFLEGHVSSDVDTPEPSSLLLAGLGFGVLITGLKLRKQAA